MKMAKNNGMYLDVKNIKIHNSNPHICLQISPKSTRNIHETFPSKFIDMTQNVKWWVVQKKQPFNLKNSSYLFYLLFVFMIYW